MGRREVMLGALGAAIAPSSMAQAPTQALQGYVEGLHDPAIIKEGGTYHVFGSGGWHKRRSMTWRTSPDLVTWTDNGPPFATPEWAMIAVPGSDVMWAPDITRHNGLFHLYYAVSTPGSMRSVIGFSTSPTLDKRRRDYRWTDHGMVIETHHGGTYNAIDATRVVDVKGGHWLAFGSYWSGLKLVALDPRTGKRRAGDSAVHSIAYRPAPEGGDNPIEGAFIHVRNGWHYLFASYDYCCKGLNSNYYTAVGRSRDIRGPYVGRDGKRMMDGYGTTVLAERPYMGTRWRGPGHGVVFNEGGRDLYVHHAYDAEANATPTLRIVELKWSDDGWPSAA